MAFLPYLKIRKGDFCNYNLFQIKIINSCVLGVIKGWFLRYLWNIL